MTYHKKKPFAAKRLDNIPPYLFAEIDKKKEAALAKGIDIINLGIGDPDKPTPEHIVKVMHEALDDPSTHNYPPYQGTPEYRQACVDWFSRRFNLAAFDRDSECLALIGMKEALHNLFLAVVDEGDYTLIPNPAYPVYKTSTILAGGEYHFMPLRAENNFIPDLGEIPEEIAQKAKLMLLNYPNNPTGRFATLDFFKEAVAFARKHEILLCHDAAYSEVYFDEASKPLSIFEVEGAHDVAIEMFSLSKGYNMTGWRVGFAVGNAEAVKALSTTKTNIDSGIFKAIQKASIHALSADPVHLPEMRRIYRERAKAAEDGLRSLGWEIKPQDECNGTLYIWQPIPRKYSSSMEFVGDMLDKCGIVVPPGVGYGEYGEGYFRIALSAPAERITEAISRMKEAGLTY